MTITGFEGTFTTLNGTSDDIFFTSPPIARIDAVIGGIPVAVILLVLMLTALTGNTLTLLSYWRYPSDWFHSEAANIFLINVAVADLIVATLVVPLHIAMSVSSTANANVYLCLLTINLSAITVQVSSNFLVLATVDKYVAIHWPLRHIRYFTKTRARLAATFTWLLVIAATFGMDAGEASKTFTQVEYCVLVRLFSKLFMLLGVVLDILPTSIMLFLNALILVTVRRQMRVRREGLVWFGLVQQHDPDNDNHGCVPITTHSLRAWRVIGTAVVIYVICRVPVSLSMLTLCIYMFDATKDVEEIAEPLSYAITVCLFNSAMNPVIYYRTMPGIRAAFKKVLGLNPD